MHVRAPELALTCICAAAAVLTPDIIAHLRPLTNQPQAAWRPSPGAPEGSGFSRHGGKLLVPTVPEHE